jgi:AcrR family transcriptional regulator
VPKLSAIRKQALDELVKEALFEAALAVLTEHGIDGMTMDRVASAASVAKGSLYRYFSGKRDLLEFIYTKTVDPLFENVTELVASEQPAVEKLAAHLRMFLEHIANHAHVFRLLFDDDTVRGLLHSSERCCREAAIEQMAEIFRQGVAEGVFGIAEPLLLANMFVGLCRGSLDSKPGLETAEQRERVHRMIMGAFLNGVATDKVRTR